jgi:hypothetical protein
MDVPAQNRRISMKDPDSQFALVANDPALWTSREEDGD